tara:strand:+ start:4512 stop:5525 length:1014 start_codon:yes stop_codon:yes gene_type:complete
MCWAGRYFRQISLGLVFLLSTSLGYAQGKGPNIWEARLNDFEDEGYVQAVAALFSGFEDQSARLSPGETGRVGIKVYTSSGPGLSTPLPLVRAVIHVLEQRGFKRENLFILGLEEHLLREAGFLPKLSAGWADFEGVPVYALSSGEYWNPVWYYESALPSTLSDSTAIKERLGDDRNSLLPMPLLQGIDFWINLPMVTVSDAFGVSGALANPTVWAISNNQRFLRSPHNAPMAIAEIAAIPELQSGWIFTIMTLERYQFMVGPQFNALYTHAEHLLWLSASAAALDYAALARVNTARKKLKFYPLPNTLPVLEYTRALGLGNYRNPQWIRKDLAQSD